MKIIMKKTLDVAPDGIHVTTYNKSEEHVLVGDREEDLASVLVNIKAATVIEEEVSASTDQSTEAPAAATSDASASTSTAEASTTSSSETASTDQSAESK